MRNIRIHPRGFATSFVCGVGLFLLAVIVRGPEAALGLALGLLCGYVYGLLDRT